MDGFPRTTLDAHRLAVNTVSRARDGPVPPFGVGADRPEQRYRFIAI
jgi:hypothetical protein